MAKNKRYLVIGMGILGQAVARRLFAGGIEVVALDVSEAAVRDIKPNVNLAVVGNSTDPVVLEQLNLSQVDGAIICIGEHFDAALLTAVHLLDQKVPFVSCRAANETSASILRRVGVHDVYFVEQIIGEVLSKKILEQV